MIFTTNHVCDAHLDVVHHVNQMKHRLAVRTHDHKVGLFLFAIGQFPHHIATDHIRDGHRFALHAKPNGPLILVGKPLGLQLIHASRIDLRALGLIVRPTIAHAVAGRIVTGRAFIPIQPQPAEPFENHIDCLRRVTLFIRVLHAKHKFPACMAGIQPIKQGRAGPANVQVARGTGRKTNSNTHARGR